MKNEGEFNAKLSSWMKTLWPKGFHHFKTSDKYQVGIADFILWGEGRSCTVETKFITQKPKEGKNWLTHTFSATQRNFLRGISNAGSGAYGLIGVKSERRMLLIGHQLIQSNGNIKTDRGGVWFPMTKMGVEKLFIYVFGGGDLKVEQSGGAQFVW